MVSTRDAVNVKMTDQSVATIKKLAGSDVMPILRREMRAATQPLAPAAKRAARNTPSKRKTKKARDGDVSLRREIANSITRKINLGPKKVLVIVAGIPKGGKSNLGALLEGTKPWSHPTYGHPPVVSQAAHPFFKKAIDAHEDEVTRAMERVLDKIESRL